MPRNPVRLCPSMHASRLAHAFFLDLLCSIAAAQSPELLQRSDAARKATSQCVVALPQRTTPGALLVVFCAATSSTTPTISGGGVTQWTLRGAQPMPSGAAQAWTGIVDASPSQSVTFTFPVSQQTVKATVGEWRGWIGSPQVVVTSASGAAAAPSPAATTGSFPVARGDLVVGMIAAPFATERIPQPSKGWKSLAAAGSDPGWFAAAGWTVADATGPMALQWDFARAQDHAAIAIAVRGATRPIAAPTLRQHASAQQWGVGSLSVQLPNPPLPGSLLVLCHESNSSVNSRISGGGVATWTLCSSSAPTIVNSEIWAGIVGPNPSDTITMTLGTSPNGALASVSEWTGMPSPLCFQAELGSGPSGGTLVRTPPVFADAHELVVAMAGIHQGGNTIGAPTNGFSELMQGYLPSTAQSAAYRVATQPGGIATTWPLAYSTRWAAPIVVFGGL